MCFSTGITNKNLNYKKETIKGQEFGYSVCILLCYQAAGAYEPRDMCLCVASVLCLSINILERSSTWYIVCTRSWIVSEYQTGKAPPPYPPPQIRSHLIHSDTPVLPAESPQRFVVKQGEWRHSRKMNNNYYTLTAWHLHKERRHIKGKVARQQGDASNILTKNKKKTSHPKINKSNKLTTKEQIYHRK